MGIPHFDFFIVGAAKSGTTSLHRYLARHPGLFLPLAKELGAFLQPPGHAGVARRLEEFYRNARPGQKVGLTEARMLMFESVPQRLRSELPDVRVVAVLRDPVERAYSGYWAARLKGLEPAATFEEAIAPELEQRPQNDEDRTRMNHLELGFYADHLARFHEALGKDQVFVLLSEDLAERREASLRALLKWLDVDPDADIARGTRRHNVTQQVRSPVVEQFLKTGARPVRGALRALLPLRTRLWLRIHVVGKLQRANRLPFERPPMKPQTRATLCDLYASDRDRLSQMLDRDLSGWLKR